MQQAAGELMGRAIAPAKPLDLLDEEPLEVELATTLLYEHCHYSYRQLRQAVQATGEKVRREIIDLGLGTAVRTTALRPFCAGQHSALIF